MKISIKNKQIVIKENLQKLPNYPPLCDTFIGKKQLVNLGEVKLYVEELGIGIPILFIHGGPGSSHHYFHHSINTPIKGLKIIFYDQRGCFKSDLNKNHRYSVMEAVEDIEKLRQKLNINKWIILGHSYGGFLAQLYKEKYPNALLGIILVCSSHGLINSDIRRTGEKYLSTNEQNRIQELNRNNELTLQENIYNSYINGDWKRQNYFKPTKKKMYFAATYEWMHDNGLNDCISDDMDNYNLKGRFANNIVPTLIIEGANDPTWDKSKPQKLQINHPRSKLVIIQNASHAPFEDKPKEFKKIIRNFIFKELKIYTLHST